MVMALGKIREARDRGREEGREEGRAEGREEERAAMIQALRDAGIPERDIRRVEAQRDTRGNGRSDVEHGYGAGKDTRGERQGS